VVLVKVNLYFLKSMLLPKIRENREFLQMTVKHALPPDLSILIGDSPTVDSIIRRHTVSEFHNRAVHKLGYQAGHPSLTLEAFSFS
jgi:hypothetical protein